MEDILILLGVILLFWLISSLVRDIICWPLKINTRIQLMEQIIANQKKMIDLLEKKNKEVLQEHTEVQQND